MKRTGQLYPLICTTEALLSAYHTASKNKRNHRACFEFGRNLGGNLAALQQELSSGTYQPMPCNRFWVVDGRKPRLIEAPAFRDMVVQHAAYAVISPLLEARYIATNFACRPGLGTHKAADWLQAVIRRAPRTSWLLHIDVRKFFYSLDRAVLQALLARIIKCKPMLAPSRSTGLRWLGLIKKHLALIGLEISHYSLQPVRRGANFCGFRTWASGRFVRPHVISAMRNDARRGRITSIISRLGHASRTRSLSPLLNFLKDHHDIFSHLPASYRRRYHPHPALA